MGNKNISISDEAYLKLSKLKRKNESFTDVINKLTKRTNVLDLTGLLSNSEAKELSLSINKIRKASSERMNDMSKRFDKK